MTPVTATMAAPAPAHLVSVVSDGYEYLAECGCGWASDWHTTPEGADRSGTEHRDATIGSPDEMDELMTALLDIQDDLAATVVWLAENWSTQLPPLGWYATGCDRDLDRPALRVMGAADPAELAAAAAVLGTVLADDPPNDSGSTRYRRATRDIGRVRLDVFASLDRCERAEAQP
jgi:hypothetical protein